MLALLAASAAAGYMRLHREFESKLDPTPTPGPGKLAFDHDAAWRFVGDHDAFVLARPHCLRPLIRPQERPRTPIVCGIPGKPPPPPPRQPTYVAYKGFMRSPAGRLLACVAKVQGNRAEPAYLEVGGRLEHLLIAAADKRRLVLKRDDGEEITIMIGGRYELKEAAAAL